MNVRQRTFQLPIVLALLLAACRPSSSGPSAGPTASATATATTPSASASASAAAPPDEPSADTLPESAVIRFEWFAYASLAHDGHKLWLDRLRTKTPPVLMLSYLPDVGKAPPDKEVSDAQRDALVRVIQAAKIGTRKPVHLVYRERAVPKYNYLLSVSWPREAKPPASYDFAWTDLTETADLAAVRNAMYELGSAKFPAVAKAMPKP